MNRRKSALVKTPNKIIEYRPNDRIRLVLQKLDQGSNVSRDGLGLGCLFPTAGNRCPMQAGLTDAQKPPPP